jgi:hypothetical protein
LRFLVIVDTSSLRLFLRAILSLSTCPISGGHFTATPLNILYDNVLKMLT